MTVSQFAVAIVVLCSLVEAFAQIFLKLSTQTVNRKLLYLVSGLILFSVEAVLYTVALQWLEISTAYPIGALCFVNVTFLSRWLLGETITGKRWSGIALITCGCALIAL